MNTSSTTQKENAKDCWNTIGVWRRQGHQCEKLSEFIHCRNCPVFSEMGRSVFEKKAPSQYLTHWRKKISATNGKDERKANGVLIFRICKEWFALPTSVLGEIANHRTVHRIPRNRNHAVTGVTNINGEIKTCYSFSRLLGVSGEDECSDKKNDRQPKRLIVVCLNGLDYVFAVDEIKGMSWYSDEDLAAAPKTLEADKLALILGALKQGKDQIAIFNVQRLQERLEGLAA